jgi:uncharacterized protein YjbI with pentapeptide repeats
MASTNPVVYKSPPSQEQLADMFTRHGKWLRDRPNNAQRLVLDGFDLRQTDFSGQDLSKAIFSSCTLAYQVFKNGVLPNAEFQCCDLTEAKFEGCDLTGTVFRDLDGTSEPSPTLLDRAVFRDCTYAGTKLYAVSFNKLTFEGECKSAPKSRGSVGIH